MATKDYPESIINVFFTIVSKTPQGGATMEDLREAYSDVKDNLPSERTIQRMVRRLQMHFDPLAYGETPEDGEEPESKRFNDSEYELPEPNTGIKKVRRGRKTYYQFQGNFSAPSISINEALLTALSIYPQHRGILKDTYKEVMQKLMGDALKGISSYIKLNSEIDNHLYVADPYPIDSKKNAKMIEEIFRAIREQKCVRLKYLRTYDGTLTERIVEPYGLICRFNNWYLTGYCQIRKERRVFHLVHIQSFRVLETSRFNIPKNFSFKDEYKTSWAIHTGTSPKKPEKVTLHISKGVAERFRVMKFHPTQTIKELKDGAVEASYSISEPNEMISWLASWGNTIKVQKPETLRIAVIENLKATIEHYSGN